jgi:type IX secretion system PorP/SprF family membrane protein
MIRYLLFLLVLALHMGARAQQQPLVTQYMFNGLVLNPAYTGSHESLTLTASYRRQWTGLRGAPQTQFFSAHSPVGTSRSALGLVASHDKVGPIHQTTFFATYAYRIPVSRYGKLAVGGQAGLTSYQVKLSSVDVVTSNQSVDPAFAADQSRLFTNLGLGIYYYDRRTYVGLSLPTVVDNRWADDEDRVSGHQQRHYYLSAGHVLDISTKLKLKPNVLFRYAENGSFQYDINTNLLINDVLWVGASYRMNDAVDGLLELLVNDQLRIGYSYGYSISNLSAVQSGTHEVTVNYRVRLKKHVVLSPRYF